MRFGAIAALALSALAVSATAQTVVKTEDGQGAIIKALDTITGEVTQFEIAVGSTIRYEHLKITVNECRYPEGNPGVEAFARLYIQDERKDTPAFEGWMIASSPALSAMEHPRYDVWVIRCTTAS